MLVLTIMTLPAARYRVVYDVILGTETPFPVACTSRDLSATGIGLQLENDVPLRTGQLISLSLQFGDKDPDAERLNLRGKVIWRRKNRCGIQITGSRDQSRDFYENLISGFQALQSYSPSREAWINPVVHASD
jgi:hypothetical protein